MTEDEISLVGIVAAETEEKVDLFLSDARRESTQKSQFRARKLQDLSPMARGLVRTLEKLRDLLAYLLSPAPHEP